MSFANLVRQLEARGKGRLKGSQCGGRVEADGSISENQPKPPRGKGAEYAAKFRAEEERAYLEMDRSSLAGGLARLNVTEGGSQMEQLEELTSVGTLPNVRELDREELTQVYERYNFDPVEPSEHLENIFNQKEKILAMIESNEVSIFQGPTGCGKSTQIPQFILDAHVKEKKHCNIVVTQPRRIAAISLAQRVCRERGWREPGGIVGYQVGLDKKVEEDTRLLYCTTGVLLEKLINRKDLNDYTHIILDEVHEREEDMDFLMLVVKRFLRTNSPKVKIVLMSATIDTKRFAEYFGYNVRGKLHPATSYEIKVERKFAVQVHYLDALSSFGVLPLISESDPKITEEAYNFVPLMIRAFNTIDATDFACRRSSEKKGAVLIFLPGLHQIETLHELLSKEGEKQKKSHENSDTLDLWLCPLHSSITREEQQNVVSYAPPGKRKVILSTNIAESSLTIPDVKYVIDFCLTKHLVADPDTGFTSLQMAWASHTNCIQREGRVGRVQDGRVYRMVPKTFYQFKMSKEALPEMLRCPLEHVVLKCKRLMEDVCPYRLISNALDPPDLDNYEKTILKLKEVGALLMTCRGEADPNDGDLTFMGRVMGSLPLDIRITKLILLGHLFDVLEDAIIMGCAMSVRNIFSEPFQMRLQAYNNKLLWANSSESDAVAYLNAYTVWRELTGIGKFERSKTHEKHWGCMNMLQIRLLNEVSMLEEEVKKRLRNFNIRPVRYKNKPLWTKQEKPLILKLVLAGAFYPNYYTCSVENLNAEIEAVKELVGHNPERCVYLQNMAQPAPLYLEQVKELLRNNNVSNNFELHYDTSQKLIVEFNQNTINAKDIGSQELCADIPGNVVMAVYRAVKLRQLNIDLPIRILPQSEAQKKINSMMLSPRISMTSMSGQSSGYKPAIPWNQEMIELTVCHVEDAGTIYGQIYPSTIQQLAATDKIVNNPDLLCEVTDVEEDVIYAAPFEEDDSPQPRYYRAKVIGKDWLHKRQLNVDVFFIDFGNTITSMLVNDLRKIVTEEAQRELYSIPPLAIKCVLAEVAPSVWSSKSGHWSPEATKYVKKTLFSEGRNLWPTRVYSYVNGVASVYLYIEEEGRDGRDPLTLNQDLFNKGFAKFREESYMSKRNHMKREEIAKGDQVIDSVEEGKIGSIPNPSDDLRNLPFTKASRINLKGPRSPLEMKLYSKTRSSCRKDVRVEWNSVNSVLLNTELNEPYEKLLVAGFVSQSTDGHKLLLNHTTVLPNLQGLAALVCLLFSPNVELRTDEFRSKYIGALCGLGCDSSNAPLFPENDMEVRFDREIKEEDLVLVNKVRYFMNKRFCSEDSEDMPEHQLFTIQQNIRELLMKLLRTSRPPVKVMYCNNKYKWNLVDENHLLPFEGTNDTTLLSGIYHLFNAIDLNPSNDYPYIRDLAKRVKRLDDYVHKDTAPMDLVCPLCDVDFVYWIQLRQHVESCNHHRQLVKWLRGRERAHGISMDSPAQKSEQSAVKPSTSRC